MVVRFGKGNCSVSSGFGLGRFVIGFGYREWFVLLFRHCFVMLFWYFLYDWLNSGFTTCLICLHHSILVLLNSNLIFTSLSQFSSFHFQYIKLFQYSCSLILASTLPLYISASLLLNSSNSLQHSLVWILNHLLPSTSEPLNLQTSDPLTLRPLNTLRISDISHLVWN